MSKSRRDRLCVLGLYTLLILLLTALAWQGQSGPLWGRVDAQDSPLFDERLDQALREMGQE